MELRLYNKGSIGIRWNWLQIDWLRIMGKEVIVMASLSTYDGLFIIFCRDVICIV